MSARHLSCGFMALMHLSSMSRDMMFEIIDAITKINLTGYFIVPGKNIVCL